MIFFCFAETKDPCAKLNCTQGAQCVRSRDGTEAECKCTESCPNLGDHEGSGPVCGSDGVDYASLCHLNKVACIQGINITVVFPGKCGKCVLLFEKKKNYSCIKIHLWKLGKIINIRFLMFV